MDEGTLKRFWSKVNKDGPVPESCPELGQCWLWKPLGSTGGYGQFSFNGKYRLVHRVAHEMFIGAIPEGLTVDHVCRTRSCVRPEHLKIATYLEQSQRAKSWEAGAAFQREKTHCPYGHPYSGDNLYIRADGSRHCRECGRRASAAHQAKKRRENPPRPRQPKEFCVNGHSFAEFGVERGGKRVCSECARERVRRYQERLRAERSPRPPKLTCKNGHPWTEDNIYMDRRGYKHCRACHNERTLARYHAEKEKRGPRPPRNECGNGHPLDGDNLYITPDGDRKCRACAHARNVRYRAKLRAANPTTPKPPRTHCPQGHEWAGDNLYVAPSGREFCRACQAERQRKSEQRSLVRNPAKGAWQRGKTHCPSGHEYTDENTYVGKGGSRKCRTCLRDRSREYQRRKRAEGRDQAA